MLSAARNKAAICKLLLDAGADADLLDPSGHSALAIAMAAGALDAAQTIMAACAKPPASGEPPPPLENLTGPSHTSAMDGGDGFDLNGWEAEEDHPPPESDSTLTAVALKVQSVITDHTPIDTSADWDDFDAFLPDRATPLPRADDAEARERMRLLLLRAIREGSVPQSAVDDLTLGDDGEPDAEAGALLGMVINDLGAETDERFEYRATHESFEVFVDPEEKPGEEDAIAETLDFVDSLSNFGNAPLRIYQRELQRGALLTAEAEVALGQDMERGLGKALDALAAWHGGLRAVLDAARRVASGAMPLRSLSSGPQAEIPQMESTPNAEPDGDASSTMGADSPEAADRADEDGDSEFGGDSKASSDEFTEFCTNTEVLAELLKSDDGEPEWNACRGAIAALGLSRNFLLNLADSVVGGRTEAADSFKAAMLDYLSARDKMAVANLKLVFSIAKKYQFSGQPLDDLLQEGNLGLLRAVDRYDWRRGYKFSTYATWWIRQQVGRFVADKGKTIRVPLHVYEKIQRIVLASRAFELECGRNPTVEEIAASVDLPVEKAAAMIRASHEPIPIDGLADLDSLIAEEAKDHLIARDPMDIVEDGQLIGLVSHFLEELPLKEQRVLRMRFGIGLADAMTLEEIGARLDVTRERIRQIEVAALRKLKHPARLNRLARELNGPSLEEDLKGADALEESADRDDLTAKAISAALAPAREALASVAPARPKNPKTTALDRLLEKARELGVAVEDEIELGARRILVRITETPDNTSRKLVRKLIEIGFNFRPGKGYWR
jgi:RNA polymerase primary sigma factor